MDSATMQSKKTSVSSGTQTNSIPPGAAAVEESTDGGGKGRSHGNNGEMPLQVQSTNITIQKPPAPMKNNAAAARRPAFEIPTWRQFSGDWR